MEKTQEFEKFLNDSLRPDYLKAVQCREDILDECREYEYLLLAIQKIQKSSLPNLNTLINLGQHVMVNAEIDDCSKIIVKMLDDLFVELPLNRAVVYVEAKIKVLTQKAEHVHETVAHIRAHMDLILSSLEELYAIQK